jgi:PBP1b-binding outer membrane lipoprotein LpoB
MKKIASLILIAVFAVAVAFVGCKKEEAPAPEEQVQEQPAEQAPAEAPVQQ